MADYTDTVNFGATASLVETPIYGDWSYFSIITITNPPSVANVVGMMVIPYDAKINNNFSDIRFADTSNNILPYFVETKTDGVTATVWIKLPANESEIRLYVGNPGATSESSGSDVFTFYDGFASEVDWVNDWQSTNQELFSATGGVLTIVGSTSYTSMMQTLNTFNNFRARASVRCAADNRSMYVSADTPAATWSNVEIGAIVNAGAPDYVKTYINGSESSAVEARDVNQYYEIDFAIPSSGNATIAISKNGDAALITQTAAPANRTVYLSLHYAASTGSTYARFIHIRPYVATEPTFAIGVYVVRVAGGITSGSTSLIPFAAEAAFGYTPRNSVSFTAATAISAPLSKWGIGINFVAETGFLQDTRQYINTTMNITLPYDSGSHEFEVDDVVIGETTGASGIVVSWTLASGTWLGGTAAGTVTLKDTAGVFVDNEHLLISTVDVADAAGVHTNLSPKIESIRISKGLQDAFWQCDITIDGYLAVAAFRDLKIVMHDHTGTDQTVFVGFIPSTSPIQRAGANKTRITAYDYAWYLSNQYTNEGIAALVSTYTYDEVALTESWLTPQVAIIDLLGGDPYYLYTTGVRPYNIDNPAGWDTAALPKRAWNWTAKTTRWRAILDIADYCEFIFHAYWLADGTPVAYFVPYVDVDTLCDIPAAATITSADQLIGEVRAEQRQGAKINRVIVNGTSTAGDYYTHTEEAAAVTNHDEKPITLVEEISGDDVDQTYVNLRAANLLTYYTLDVYSYRAQLKRRCDLRLMQKVTSSAALTVMPDGDYRINWIEYYQKGVNLVVSVQLIPDAVLQAQRKLTRVLGEVGSDVASIEAVVKDTIDTNIPLEQIGEVISVDGSISIVRLLNGTYAKGIIV